MPNRARILPSKKTVMKAFSQKLMLFGSLLKDSVEYWAIEKPGMFISRMPSRATPRRASRTLSLRASETGVARVVAGVSARVWLIGSGPQPNENDSP